MVDVTGRMLGRKARPFASQIGGSAKQFRTLTRADCATGDGQPSEVSAPDLWDVRERRDQAHQLHLPGDAELGVDALDVPTHGAFAAPRLDGEVAHGLALGRRLLTTAGAPSVIAPTSARWWRMRGGVRSGSLSLPCGRPSGSPSRREAGRHRTSPTPEDHRVSPATAVLAGSHLRPPRASIPPWCACLRPGLSSGAFGLLTVCRGKAPSLSGCESRPANCRSSR